MVRALQEAWSSPSVLFATMSGARLVPRQQQPREGQGVTLWKWMLRQSVLPGLPLVVAIVIGLIAILVASAVMLCRWCAQ